VTGRPMARVARVLGIGRATAYRDLGLMSLEPIDAGGSRVVPREVFHALLEPRIGAGDASVPDICVMRVKAVGERRGLRAVAIVELVDRYDEATGFTAMQRLTGWHAAICLELAMTGGLEPGVVPVERVPPGLIVSEGRARRWAISSRID